MLNIDERLSRAIFDFTKKSVLLTKFAIFCGSFLIWLMMGFAIGRGFSDLPFLSMMVLIPWVITGIISFLVKRPRPFEAEHYKPIIKLFVYTNSFPSAHSTLAFALPVAFTFKTLFDPLTFTILFACAILVAIGRVAVGVHRLSDVIVGALIGGLTGFFILSLFGLIK